MKKTPFFIILLTVVFAQAPAVAHKSGWQELKVISINTTKAALPKSSFAAAANQEGSGSGWIFGGVLNDFSETPIYNNDFFQVDVIDNLQAELLFRHITTHGPEPSARAFPSLAVILDRNHEDVYLFGGGTFPDNRPLPSTDKFWRFDGDTKSWTDLSDLGGPSPRLGATAVAAGDSVYVFGGIAFDPVNFFVLYNDLWRFDISEQQWTLLSDGVGPQPRHMAMAAIAKAGNLIIFGGERVELNPQTFEAAFPIDTSTWRWSRKHAKWQLLAEGPPRNYSGFAGYRGNLIVFGGDSAGGDECADADFAQNPSNDLFVFSSRFGWRELGAGSSIPLPVKRNSGFVLGKYFYTLGGFNFTCEEGQSFLDSAYRYRLR